MKEGVGFLLYLEPIGKADASVIADVMLLISVPLGAQQHATQQMAANHRHGVRLRLWGRG